MRTETVMSAPTAPPIPAMKQASTSTDPSVRRLFELADQHEFAEPEQQDYILDEFLATLVGE